jgi:hypothetical protein
MEKKITPAGRAVQAARWWRTRRGRAASRRAAPCECGWERKRLKYRIGEREREMRRGATHRRIGELKNGGGGLEAGGSVVEAGEPSCEELGVYVGDDKMEEERRVETSAFVWSRRKGQAHDETGMRKMCGWRMPFGAWRALRFRGIYR